jgi:hypothetical protein
LSNAYIQASSLLRSVCVARSIQAFARCSVSLLLMQLVGAAICADWIDEENKSTSPDDHSFPCSSRNSAELVTCNHRIGSKANLLCLLQSTRRSSTAARYLARDMLPGAHISSASTPASPGLCRTSSQRSVRAQSASALCTKCGWGIGVSQLLHQPGFRIRNVFHNRNIAFHGSSIERDSMRVRMQLTEYSLRIVAQMKPVSTGYGRKRNN